MLCSEATLSKTCFTLYIEDQCNVRSRALLDLIIQIKEFQAKALGHSFADGGLAGTRRPDEKEIPVVSHAVYRTQRGCCKAGYLELLLLGRTRSNRVPFGPLFPAEPANNGPILCTVHGDAHGVVRC